MKPATKLSDLLDSLSFEDSDEHAVYFDQKTMQVVLIEQSVLDAVEDDDEESLADMPDWQKEEIPIARAIAEDKTDRFIEPPSKFEFNEYRHMQEFIWQIPDPVLAEQMEETIRGQGAFRRFKEALQRVGLLDDWFKYRDEAQKKFVIAWAKENNLSYQDDLKKTNK